ncbi:MULTISPECIES: hypothetical protein [unclassified Pseudomonas]|uniref:hypothetical protein n=1 Tax=unclassified Pseudomonas TaxID=196821 RepID=UPI00345DA75F
MRLGRIDAGTDNAVRGRLAGDKVGRRDLVANSRPIRDLIGQADQKYVTHQDVQAVDAAAVVAVEHPAPGVGHWLRRGGFADRIPDAGPHVGAGELGHGISQLIVEGLGQIGLNVVA